MSAAQVDSGHLEGERGGEGCDIHVHSGGDALDHGRAGPGGVVSAGTGRGRGWEEGRGRGGEREGVEGGGGGRGERGDEREGVGGEGGKREGEREGIGREREG